MEGLTEDQQCCDHTVSTLTLEATGCSRLIKAYREVVKCESSSIFLSVFHQILRYFLDAIRHKSLQYRHQTELDWTDSFFSLLLVTHRSDVCVHGATGSCGFLYNMSGLVSLTCLC